MKSVCCIVAPSGKLTMIARPNQILRRKEEKRVSEKSTRKAPNYAVESRVGTESLCFSTGIAALPLPYC